MRRRNDGQARIVEFWRAVEMVGPPPVPEVRRSERVFRVLTGTPLPWQRGHELEHEPLPAGMTWRHTVYGGIFSLRRVREVLEEEFGAAEEPLDAPKPGDSALFALTVTHQGRPVLGTQELSCCAWAVGRLAGAAGEAAAAGTTTAGKPSRTGRSRRAGGSSGTGSSGRTAGARSAPATGWWEGFGRSAAVCDAEFARLVGVDGDHDDGEDVAAPVAGLTGGDVRVGRPLDHMLLAELVDRVRAEFGVGTVLEPKGIRVRSVLVAEGAPYDTTGAGGTGTAGSTAEDSKGPKNARTAKKTSKTSKSGKAGKVDTADTVAPAGPVAAGPGRASAAAEVGSEAVALAETAGTAIPSAPAGRGGKGGKAGRAAGGRAAKIAGIGKLGRLGKAVGAATGRDRASVAAEAAPEATEPGTTGEATEAGAAGKGRRIDKAVTAARAADAAVAGTAGGMLNGPVVADLARVAAALEKGERGAALNAYLSGAKSTARGRVDVRKDLKAVYEAVAPEHVPAGRWPAKSGRVLSLSQQFAASTALARLTEAPGAGLFSVGAPPGTGSIEVLRELVAANVVKRASRLAALSSTYAAFGPALKWKVAGETRVVTTWKEQLTGFEMVVAAPVDGAADAAVRELTGGLSVDEEWLGEARHLAGLAGRVLASAARAPAGAADEDADYADPAGGHETEADDLADWPRPAAAAAGTDADDGDDTDDTYDHYDDTYDTYDPYDPEAYEEDEPYGGGEPYEPAAWGLIAARLGDTRSRERFVQSFWLRGATGAPGMLDILQRPKSTKTAWRAAVREFKKAERAVADLMDKRANVFRQAGDLPDAEREQDRLEREHQRAQQVVTDLERRIAREAAPIPALNEVAADRERDRREHQASKPGAMGGLLSRRRLREWQDREDELAAAAAKVEQRLQAAQGTLAHLRAMHASALQAAEEHEARLDAVRVRVASGQSVIRRARRDLAEALPITDWWDDDERRERAAPWTDEAWNAARTRLFLAALGLHRAFLAAEADRMRKNLQAAMDVLLGTVPSAAPRKAVLAAWQSLFFVVPVVATTLASFDQVFSRLGRESLGWLFVDDAGQAAPQQALGAIWRARRAVAIGDPHQLEPVTTVPVTVQRALREHFTVDESWLPAQTSAQRLADQVNRYGTMLPTRGGDLWIGPVLRVHRRCDGPMFGISNAVAYHGIMIDGVPARGPVQPEGYPAPPDSKWIDIPAATAGPAVGHWLPEEAEELRFVLRRLRTQCGITSDRVMVLTPFRQVAEGVAEIADRFPGLAAGTVHTAAGRDADIVIFVLGGRPGADGAREWAAARPNLVNVAVSRARRRLYVIGDHAVWSPYPYFDDLAAGLTVTASIRPIQDFIDLEPGEPAGTA